ncbi:MAG TPA: tetratricopeptide repeat protein [Pirellulales bacterium]|nr:tetratricopeptide repeat protein [Pirellulales bacterium]
MKRKHVGLFVVGLVCCLTAVSVAAQRKNGRGKNQPQPKTQLPQQQFDPTTGIPIFPQPDAGKGKEKEEEKGPDLPSDPELMKIHAEFVAKTVKLAKDYERKKDIEKAQECYERILKLLPRLPEAEEALAKIKTKQLNADKKKMTVNANSGWQDTGVDLLEGKPVAIQVAGNQIWMFRMSQEVGPDGMKIPEELREFNLGSLIGKVETGGNPKDIKPFLVGSGAEFTPEKSGRLFLRMYDADPSDNTGRLSVEIHGTFGGR